jgi:hypothetical protein
MTIEERVSAALRMREQEIQAALREQPRASVADELLAELWELSRQQTKVDILGV